MLAITFAGPGQPLPPADRPTPEPPPRHRLIPARACRVRPTDPHAGGGGPGGPGRPAGRAVAGALPHPKPRVIPGHEVVGVVEKVGDRAAGFRVGDRVGVPWLGHTDGVCGYCRSGRENLCDNPEFTGY